MNAEAVAVFATLAPRSDPGRGDAGDPRPAGRDRPARRARRGGRWRESTGEGGSPHRALGERWRRGGRALPAHDAVLPHLEQASSAASRASSTPTAPPGRVRRPLRAWALGLEAPAEYRWWEVAAGASSSVAAHALIAAAADPRTTAETAALIDAAYQPPIGALTVFLDDLVDRDEDLAAGEHNYLVYYESSEAAAERLALIAGRAEALIARPAALRPPQGDPRWGRRLLPQRRRRGEPYARPIRERLLDALGPGARLLTAFMRVRRLGERKRPGQAGNSPGP